MNSECEYSLNYDSIPFKKDKDTVTLVLLHEPVDKGFATFVGMVQSNLFPENIGLVVDQRFLETPEYDYMCLSANEDNSQVMIWMEKVAYEGIQKRDQLALHALFHELGHFFLKHTKHSTKDMEAYDNERLQCVMNGYVIHQELDADRFAADFLGTDFSKEGLDRMRDRNIARYESGNFEVESCELSIKELELRIDALMNQETTTHRNCT